MKFLFVITLVLFATSSLASAEKPECEAFLARDAYVRLAEGAWKKTLITAADLRRVAESARPLNPVMGKPASVESVSFQKAFATVIGSMTPESWPEVQRAILQFHNQATTESEARGESRENTRPILRPLQIFKKKVSASTWLVDWKPSGADVAFNFWDRDRSDWIQQVQLKTGFKKKKDVLKFDFKKWPERAIVESVFQMAGGKTYLSGWHNGSFRWITNAVAYTHMDEGSRNSTLQTSTGRLFFSRMVRGSDGNHSIQVLEMAEDGTWAIRKSYQTGIPHAASLFEHQGHVFAAFEVPPDGLRVECVTSPAVLGRTLNVRGKTTTFNSQVLQTDTASYLLTFYYDDNDNAALELHDPFRPGETRIFESKGEMGFSMDTAKLWRDPMTGRLVMAIKGYKSILFYDLESRSPILRFPLPVPQSMSWRVVDDQVYLATVGEDSIMRIFQIYNEAQK